MFARLALVLSALLLLPELSPMPVHTAIPADSTRVVRFSKELKIRIAPPAGQVIIPQEIK